MAQADSTAPAWRRYIDPYLAPVVAGAKDVVAFLDKRVPHIRGRPALSELVANIKPGLTVALVSLPLSISLALAADATPVQVRSCCSRRAAAAAPLASSLLLPHFASSRCRPPLPPLPACRASSLPPGLA